MPECLSALSVWVHWVHLCPLSAQVYKCPLSAPVAECHLRASVVANSVICFTLYLYSTFQGREKHVHISLYIKNALLRFSDLKLSWILRYSRDFSKLTDVMSDSSKYFFVKNCFYVIGYVVLSIFHLHEACVSR